MTRLLYKPARAACRERTVYGLTGVKQHQQSYLTCCFLCFLCVSGYFLRFMWCRDVLDSRFMNVEIHAPAAPAVRAAPTPSHIYRYMPLAQKRARDDLHID